MFPNATLLYYFVITQSTNHRNTNNKKIFKTVLQYIVPSSSDHLNGSESSENVKKRKLDTVQGDNATTTESKHQLLNPQAQPSN